MRTKFHTLLKLASGVALLASACTPASTATPAGNATPAVAGDLFLYSGRAEALVLPVIAGFKTLHPDVNIVLKAGSNAELANALLEERANPQADLFLTTELVTVQKMATEGVLQAYRSTEAAGLDPRYQNPDGLWTGLTLRARVIMYNTELVAADEAPRSIMELTNPKWQGQVAAAGSTNGSFQAQVAAMRQLLGDEAALAWLAGLRDNDVTFFGGHTDVRKAVGAGEFRLGLVNHYYYHLQKAEGSPVAVVYPDQGANDIGLFVNATAIGLVAGAPHSPAAQAFVDYLLSAGGQKIFADLNYEYPLRSGVALHPDVAPLAGLKLANFDLVQAANDVDSTLDMLETAAIP